MKRKFIYAAVIFISVLSLQHKVFCQQTFDSLLRSEINTIADSTKVSKLIDAAQSNMYTNVQYSLKLCMYALQHSLKINYVDGKVSALILLGEAFSLNGNLSEGLEAALKGVDEAEKNHDKHLMSYAYTKCGVIYGNVGDHHSAINYYRKSLNLFARPDTSKIVLFGLLGESFIKENKLDSALYYSQRAYELDITRNEHWGLAYINLGNIHTQYRHYPLALEYFRTVLSLKPLTLDSIEANIGMGKIFVQTGEWDSVLLYAKRAIHLAKENNYPSYLASAYALANEKFKTEGRFDSAFIYQHLMISMKDSIFAREKMSKLENLKFSDQLRQLEIRAANEQATITRKHNLQFALIGISLLSFIILFLTLSNSIIVSAKFVRLFGIVVLLLVFEFINLYVHPFIGGFTNHSPFGMFLIMVCIAALLAPLHTRLENWVTHQLVEKNTRIRVAAAKKILEENEKTQ